MRAAGSILAPFTCALAPAPALGQANPYALCLFGHGTGDIDRVKIRIDAPARPADEKHDAGPAYPSFSGWLDEVRLSTTIRYTAPFTPPLTPFVPHAAAAALYHFDEGSAGPCTGTVLDALGASDGVCRHGGGGAAGPVYVTDVPPIGASECGNGVPEPGEECDDGNPTPGDGCEPDCRLMPTDALTSGRSLAVQDEGGDPTKRKLAGRSRDPALMAPAPGSPGDPSLHGASLTLGRGAADTDTWLLPAAGWLDLGTPRGSRGWRYAEKARAFGPCRQAKLVPGRQLKAACAGAAIAFTLDEPAQGGLAMRFAPGTSGLRTCLAFGGTVAKDFPAAPGQTGRFVARAAPAPTACPLP